MLRFMVNPLLVMWFEFPTMLILSTTDVWKGERFKRRSTTKAAATGQARQYITRHNIEQYKCADITSMEELLTYLKARGCAFEIWARAHRVRLGTCLICVRRLHTVLHDLGLNPHVTSTSRIATMWCRHTSDAKRN